MLGGCLQKWSNFRRVSEVSPKYKEKKAGYSSIIAFDVFQR
jgi:hypothetical protein